jgi:hypothetical protein
MRRHGSIRRFAPLAVAVLALAAAACSSDDADDSADGSSTTEVQQVSFDPHVPTDVAPPPAEGNGISLPQPAPAVPDDYVLEEYLVGGTATGFDAVDTPADGHWVVEPGDKAEYRTRVVVRRPADADAFSGTVLVEWFNVSAIEAAPDWGYLSEEILREGHAYVGVSAQVQGVEGGDTLLDVEVDQEQAEDAGVDTDRGGLKNTDPDRYGTLVHPGDAYSFDIFSQVARAIEERPADLLGELAPEQVIGVGESQSAMFLSTLINAVHPLAPVFDGFLVHSRGASVPSIDGSYISSREAQGSDDPPPPVRIRTDLEVPVLIFEAETDLTVLGYAQARQDDTDLLRTWEIAGTAHADAQTLRAVVGGPRDPGLGSLLGCGPINTGPHKEVLQAAVHHLVAWVAGGEPPPEAPRLELDEGEQVAIARDEHGIALGGVRNPLVDVPVATVAGDPPEGTSEEDVRGDVCVLFGTTTPFDQDTIAELYASADDYVEQFRTSAEEAVAAGHLLQPDADALVAEAEANRTLFP